MVSMNKITRLSIAKIRKHKKESIFLGILVFICTVLLSSSISSFAGISKITPSMVENTGCFANSVTIAQKSYTNDFLDFLDDERVENYDHISVAYASIMKVNGEDRFGSFVSVSGEERYEKFDHSDSEAEHPVWLNKRNMDEYGVKVGDEITFTYERRDFTFTVAGSFDSGIWPLSNKAVVTDEDLEYLEGYLERYEVIGVNLVSGTDSKAFFKEFEDYCKSLSSDHIENDISVNTFEDTSSSNSFNMSILSVIIAAMAGVTVIAIMVMIRYRIVGDIEDQIVSIGVLEVIGYKSRQIAGSYIMEYLLISAAGAVLGIVPGLLLTRFLQDNAASTIGYSGKNSIQIVPFILSVFFLLLFILLIARSRARAVRKYPPVLAFRKGIKVHHFKKSLFPLEKTKGSVHLRLALKGFAESRKQRFGLGFCIMTATLTVVLSFLLFSFFGDPEAILNNVCGHEACDITIEAAGAIDDEDYRKELESIPGVKKVLLSSSGEGIRYVDSDVETTIEVYDDFSDTSYLALTEGRYPQHDNEIMISTQGLTMTKSKIGDTVTVGYGTVERDYVITGAINSVVDASVSYMTTDGFKKINPAYTHDAFLIYLNDEADTNEVADLLESRYGKNITDISNSDVTGETYEEKIRSKAEIKMAEAMIKNGVSYMEYAIEVDGQMISGSTNMMKISSMTFTKEDYQGMLSDLAMIFGAITAVLMFISAFVVMIILSILMEATIRKQYRDLGIMKSMGYTSRELMFQMAFKIIPTAVIAVILGTIAGIVLIKLMEVFVAKIAISVIGVILVDLAILLFCFICAYGGARKIKKISVYQLITE